MISRYMFAAMAFLTLALPAADFQAGIDIGGTYRMFTQGEPAALQVWAADSKPAKISVKLSAADIFGNALPWHEEVELDAGADGKRVKKDVPFNGELGYYAITAEFSNGADILTRSSDLGVIPKPAPGLRPESFFASNTSALKMGKELELLRMIGMKVQRVHFQANLGAKPPETPNGPLTLKFDDQDKRLAASKEAGIWVLPIAGYSFENLMNDLARRAGTYGPPRDTHEFVSTWEQILKHYPEITAYEFWNEPWIFGWNFAGTGEEYRNLQKAWCEMALKVNPNYRIVAGNSAMFCEDHIEPDPACYKGLLQGTTHHPYSFSTGAASYRAGDNGRSMDHGMQITRRMGLQYYYLTEGGTEFVTLESPDTLALRKRSAQIQTEMRAARENVQKRVALKKELDEVGAALALRSNPKNNIQNARKVVQYYVRAALTGAFQGNAQWDIGYGPEWTRANTAFATMTRFIEDRPIVADIWPENELICGAIFANPAQVTDAVKALPRAAELSARWKVAVPAGRANDATKVAVVWSLTGASNQKIDLDGTLTIADPADMKAFDMTGRPIQAVNGELKIPFNENPVYITSALLDVEILRKRIAEAKIEKLTALNLYALSLSQPANEKQALSIRIENQLNREVEGSILVACASAGSPTGVKLMPGAKIRIAPAALAEVLVPWEGVLLSAQNQYALTLTARTDAGEVVREQTISTARFVKRTIQADGSLDDWKGVTPVMVDSAGLSNAADPTQYLLNPGLKRPEPGDAKHVSAWVYTAYDEQNVYLAAAVNQDQFECNAGQPVLKGRGETKVELPFKKGDPAGLDHIRNCGDVFMFSFGFRERVPGWGRQVGDPYMWKGQFYDTDYHYAAHASKDGDKLIRQWGPDTARRTAYQTEVVPGAGPVDGAKIAIRRDEVAKLTIYEIAIPRKELALFDPKAGRCRFGFILPNSQHAGEGGALQWSEAAGVFDHWRSAGSFAPSWMQVLPCQTFFGIEK